MNFSYWEKKSWFTQVDFTVVGSGIVGLNCALELRKKYPKAFILILEKGILPQGASTKNAGFACFGSVSELLDDLTHSTESEVVELVKQRIEGLEALRSLIGDDQLGYKPWGGYELFSNNDSETYENCLEKISYLNTLLFPIFGEKVYEEKPNTFGFNQIKPSVIFSPHEGQIDTGKMMKSLLQLVRSNDIQIINSTSVQSFESSTSHVLVKTDNNIEFKTSQLFIATNGFSRELGIKKVSPARAQVLITHPIPNLTIKGTFHLDKGYYYFRNIDNRILLGGGRNLDFHTEKTTQFGSTELIQSKLEELLHTTILPNTPVEIDHRWSGIMGVGEQKKPLISSIHSRVHCGIRLGGMGIAIGTLTGKKLANLISN